MKDIDFDELDRAVGSALGNGKTIEPVADKPAEAPVPADEPEATPAASTESASDAASVESAPSEVPSQAPPARPAPAQRRSSGRFMDVVHPSSDMKAKSDDAISTSGKTLQPLSNDLTPPPAPTPPASPNPVAVTPATTPTSIDKYELNKASVPDEPTESPQPSEPAVQTESQEVAWPDPLDIADKPTPDEPVAEINEPQTPPLDTPAVTEPAAVELEDDNDATDSTQSPFLSDTKVEKRPLGAFGLEADPATGADVAGTTDTDAPSADAPTQAETPSSQLPPELQQATVEVEAQEVNEPEETDEPEAAAKESTPKTEAAPAASTTPAMNQSIAPQYRTETTDAEVGGDQSVFDTEQYHQPLLAAHAGPSRGKRAALTAVIIVVLLAIGAAIGYAAYVYNTGA